ncbi:hypothetical protein VIGAN_08253700 [Vigna angularis var. angularis]|uniref:Uncharacterized protein n=1 Tax=Vigna angularis var. angularis TaxID=157739 RepID=A0A0S3SSE5_PHAAN|nr:hypothetical protein VIGAN_08253700 [Vigna angularis var. angularis]
MKRGTTAPSRGDRGAVILFDEIGRRVSYCSSTISEVASEGLQRYQHPHRRDASLMQPPSATSLVAVSVRSCDADGNTRRRRRCNLVDFMVELDRILRLEGTVVVRDTPEVIERVACDAHAMK